MPAQGKSVLKKLLIVVAILIAILLILPWFIHVDRYRPEVISQLERLTARKVEMGRISVRFLPKISLVVQDFAIGNPPGFPSGNFITAATASANLKIGPLLHRRIVIESIQINKPVIMLISKGEDWNFANPPSATLRGASYTVPLQATVGEIVISDAYIMLAHVRASGEISPPSLEATDAMIDLKSVSVGNPLAPAAFSPDGTGAGPTLRRVSLEGGAVFQSANLYQVTAQGSLSAKGFRFNQVNLTHLKSNLKLGPGKLTMNPFSFDAFDGKGDGNFQMDLEHANTPYQVSLSLTRVDVAKLLAAFPGGNGKMTGSLNADCLFLGDFAGSPDPWAGKQANGKLTVLNGRVPDLKLNRNILQMMKIAGLGPVSGDITAFSSISADFALRDGLLTSRSITLIGNGLRATGQGSANLDQAPSPTLDYQGVAQIKAAATPLTNALSSLVQIPIHNGMVDLPFRVSGTLNQPKFAIEPPAGMATGLGGAGKPQGTGNSSGNLIQGIMGLFGKKPATKK